jgi:rhodanese-related sulfurtransferase
MHIGLTGQFAPWSGSLLKPEQAVVLIAADPEQVKEAAVRLARVGLHKVTGYLDGGIPSWVQAGLPLDSLPQLSVEDVREELAAHSTMEIIDVRRPQEFATGHVPQAKNIPLSELEKHIQELPGDRPVAVICASGYRSSIASSILKMHGFKSPINVVGGTKAWERSGLPLAIPH